MNHSSVPSRRRRSDAAERARWAQRFNQSNLSQREFALQHGLGLSTLQRWLRQNPATSVPPVFAELKLPTPSARWAAEVVRPNGTLVRLAHDAPATWLQFLLSPC